MRGVVALALLLSLASSGCFVSEDDLNSAVSEASASGSASVAPKGQTGTTASGTGSAAGTSSTSAQAGSAANEAPTAGLNATALTGSAPLNVTFTVSGSDADGDALSWTLQDGNTTLGNGTTLPANVTATFEAGNHTVVLRVSDGAANATANVTIQVTAAAVEAPAAAGTTEDDYAVFNADGTCDAKGEIDVAGEYVHDRGSTPGTGFFLGSGTWIYEESNGIDGLQLGGADDTDYASCLNPDTLIF